MKKLLLVMFLVLISTTPAMAVTRTVCSSGCDHTTLSAACSAASSGDTIYVSGAITDNSVCNLPIGVDIDGAGTSTAVITTSAAYLIYGASSMSADPVAQNSTIQNIKIDGDGGGASEVSNQGILFQGRDEITIQDAEFEDFKRSAIHIACQNTSWGTKPSYWGENITIQRSTFTNCSADDSAAGKSRSGLNWATGCIQVEAIKGLDINNNTIDNSDESDSGVGIKHTSRGWFDAADIYENTITNHIDAGNDFALELFQFINDSKIRDNTFYGHLSFVRGGQDTLEGSSSWHLQIYNNTVDISSSSTSLSTIEQGHRHTVVYNNHLIGNGLNGSGSRGLTLKNNGDANYGSDPDLNHVVIRNNVIEGYKYRCVYFADYDQTLAAGFDDIDIVNNVCDQNSGSYNDTYQGEVHIEIGSDTDTWNDIVVRNNIIMNGNNYCVSIEGANASNVTNPVITHNYCYNNRTDSIYDAGSRNPTINNNTDGDPGINEFGNKPDPFYLASSIDSNCVDAGTSVGLPYSGSAPDIGAYELPLVSSRPPDPPTGLSIVDGR
jgi:hypothetical protein